MERAQQFLADLDGWSLLEAAAIAAIAYAFLYALEKTILWVSERVPLQFRLRIKQSVPFLNAAIVGITLFVLADVLFDLSSINVLAATGTIAVALGFAFKDYASSVIAGLIALFEVPYQVGDRIKIGEEYGEVISFGLRGIRIRSPLDDFVTIPHNRIWTEAITNANKGQLESQATTNFYFSHSADIDLAVHLLRRVAYTSKYTQLQLPVITIVDEQAWGTRVQLKSYPMDARDEFGYQTDLVLRAKQAFARHEIQYPSERVEIERE